jgi:predicted porin
MKNKFLALVALVTMSVMQAQEKGSNVSFGVKAGLNSSSAAISRSYDSDVNALTGFYVGGFAKIKLSEKFAFQPELLYSAQGYKEYTNDNGYIYDDKVKLSYLSLPLSFKYTVAKSFSLEAGPQVDFLLGAKLNGTYYDPMFLETSTANNADVKNSFQSVVFGLNLGAGYQFTKEISANVRYHIGLSDAADINATTINNRVLQLGVGYTFK